MTPPFLFSSDERLDDQIELIASVPSIPRAGLETFSFVLRDRHSVDLYDAELPLVTSRYRPGKLARASDLANPAACLTP